MSIKKNKDPSKNGIFNLDTYFREHCLSILTLFFYHEQKNCKNNIGKTCEEGKFFSYILNDRLH